MVKLDPVYLVRFPSWFSIWNTDRFRVLEQTDLRLVLCGRIHTLWQLIAAVVIGLIVFGICVYLMGMTQGRDENTVMDIFTFGMIIFLVAATFWIASKPYRVMTFDVMENTITEEVVQLFPHHVDIRRVRFSDVTAVEACREVMWGSKQPLVHLVAIFIQLGSDRIVFQTAKQAKQTLAHADWIRAAAHRARKYVYPH
ncbi:MAG: hypothetical protein ABJ327_24375 [Litoreibacter sp.]